MYTVAIHINYIINNGFLEKPSMSTAMSGDVWVV